jgi:hypothetical protein
MAKNKKTMSPTSHPFLSLFLDLMPLPLKIPQNAQYYHKLIARLIQQPVTLVLNLQRQRCQVCCHFYLACSSKTRTDFHWSISRRQRCS